MFKKLIVIGLGLLLCSSVVYADPRMETRDNFCHWIHDTINDDNETFVADCGSQISVLQTENGGVAQGFARVVRDHVPADFDEVTTLLSSPPTDENGDEAPASLSSNNGKGKGLGKAKGHGLRQTLTITSEDFPGLDCTMVDSNGTNYTTQDWVSTISFRLKSRAKDYGTLTYQLRCNNGQEQD